MTSRQQANEKKTINTVWLASYPRSGNTFLRTILWHCFGLRSSSIYPNDLGDNQKLAKYVGHIERGPDIQKQRQENGISLIKTHGPPTNNDPAIYVIRDGRAACVSLWKFHQEDPTLESFSLKVVIQGQHRFGTWSNHVTSWNPWNRPNTLILEYEQLKNDLPGVLKSICKFLNREIINTAIPDRKTIAQVAGQWVKNKTDWESVLSGADLELFNQTNKTILEKFKYI